MGWLLQATSFSQITGTVALSQIAPGTANGEALVWNATAAAWQNTLINKYLGLNDLMVDNPNPPGGTTSFAVLGGRLLLNANVGYLATGVMSVSPIWLPAGFVVNNFITRSATTPLSVGTHQFMALYSNYTDATGANSLLQCYSDDFTNAAWGANTSKTWPVTHNGAGGAIASFTIPTSDWYGFGLMVAATTPPSIRGEVIGATGFSQGDVAGMLALGKTVGAGLTYPPPASLNGFAQFANLGYGALT